MLYDLIIIGAGAVGLFLAKNFKEKRGKNASVLVLERKKQVGGKICSGLVSERFFNLMSKDRKEIEFLKDILIEMEFKKAKIFVESSFFDFEGRAFAIDRKKLEEILLEKLKNLGVEVQFSREVSKIQERKNFVEVFTKDGGRYLGRVLAGCDGALSFTASQLNLPKQKKLLLGAVVNLPLHIFHAPNFDIKSVSLFFSKNFPGFFAWQIPKKEAVELGIALEPKYKPKEKLEKWLKNNFNINIAEIKFKSALIPFYPLKRTVSRRVFLCGDSAGMNKPYTGGGLIYGFEAAKIAARTIDFQNPNLKIYEKYWRKLLMLQIHFGNFLKNCYRLPGPVKKFGLWALSKIPNIDQDKPTTIFRR